LTINNFDLNESFLVYKKCERKLNTSMIVKVEKREGIDSRKGYTYDCVKFFLENNFVCQIE